MHRLEACLAAAGIGAALASATAAQDVVVPAGTAICTNGGTFVVDSLTIEAGAILCVQGSSPLQVIAHDRIVIDGTLDASGVSALDVATLGTGNIPELGAPGVGAGGSGGSGSLNTTGSTPKGGDGFAPLGFPPPPAVTGGRGGESGFGVGSKDFRRPGGGAGGMLALGVPGQVGPAGHGLVPEDGEDGHPQATGAVSGQSPPQGGASSPVVFLDGTPTNDYWGKRLDLTTGQVVPGEALFPAAGFGGGAGGDAVPGPVFPHPSWGPSTDEKGGAGGGGGGLVVLRTNRLVVGPGGRVLVNGGNGAAGENTIATDRIGGGGGGGSGGWLVLSARTFDLRHASGFTLQAYGGRGAQGKSGYGSINAGGDGGPGVIQLHTPHGLSNSILLPIGVALDDLSAPNAYVLLPLQ